MLEVFVPKRQLAYEVKGFLETLPNGEERNLISQFVIGFQSESQRERLTTAAGELIRVGVGAKEREALAAGFIFERIALIHLGNTIDAENAKGVSRPKFLLLPEDIEEIYGRIFGEDSISSISELQRAIKGKTMPDAITIRDAARSLEITGIYEAKAGDVTPDVIIQARVYRKKFVERNLQLDNKRGRIVSGGMIHDIRPDIPNKPVSAVSCKKIFLCPIDSNLHQFGGYSSIKVPITRKSLNELAYLYSIGNNSLAVRASA